MHRQYKKQGESSLERQESCVERTPHQLLGQHQHHLQEHQLGDFTWTYSRQQQEQLYPPTVAGRKSQKRTRNQTTFFKEAEYTQWPPRDCNNPRLGVNPLAICSEYKMSAQEEDEESSRSKRFHYLPDASVSESSSINPSVEGTGGARYCDLLDRVLADGSSQSPVAASNNGDNHRGGEAEERVDLSNEFTCFHQESFLSLFKSCHLQQEKTPLKIVRASQQYMYDDTNTEYLDCINSVAHVGHCHPEVVDALSYALSSTITTCGWEIDRGNLQYIRKLQQTLPSNFDAFLFCDSGSEAVDLSMQISRLYTCSTDAVVVDNAFHGSLDSVYLLSRKVSKEEVDWVHVIPMPDLYRGAYQSDDPQALNKYLVDSQEILDKALANGRKIACFLAEPMLTIPGIIMPPSKWLQEIYRMVRKCGGLCIADEVQTGLGRIGSHFWSFLYQNIKPDIIIIGKPLGNGYPMAAVVTSREIAAVLGNRVKEYECTTAMDAVGCAVLDVTERSQFMSMAENVGTFIMDQLTILKKKHEYIGDVRGKGFLFGIEIVWSKRSKKPSRDIAEHIVYRMKEENVLLANEGLNRNILMFLPPMCFTMDNAVQVTEKLDKVLSELPTTNVVKDLITGLPMLSSGTESRDVRLGIFQPQEEDEDDDSGSLHQNSMDLQNAQHCYQDLD